MVLIGILAGTADSALLGLVQDTRRTMAESAINDGL
jgi:hypothetical protein